MVTAVRSFMLLLDRAFSFLYIYTNKTKKDRDNIPNFVCLMCVKTHKKELLLSFHFQKNYHLKNVLFEFLMIWPKKQN